MFNDNNKKRKHMSNVNKKASKNKKRNEENFQEQITLLNVDPLTENQEIAFDSFDDGKNLLMTGTAGTGKTFLSLYLGMELLSKDKTKNNLIIIRSLVSTRDIGFLPGSEKEKAMVYEAPYYALFSELYKRGDAYELFKAKNLVRFISTSFVRGITINNSIIVIDEIQNMSSSEIHSVFTRIGKNCRVIICGDIKQNDLSKGREKSGFEDFFKVINNMKEFESIEFTKEDIVRSGLVKSYIIERENLELQGKISTI
jgi:phosphate starvation-inducible protein PhoH